MKRLLAYLFIVLGFTISIQTKSYPPLRIADEKKVINQTKYYYCLKKNFTGFLDDLNSMLDKNPCSSDEYEIDYATYDKITNTRYKIAKNKITQQK